MWRKNKEKKEFMNTKKYFEKQILNFVWNRNLFQIKHTKNWCVFLYTVCHAGAIRLVCHKIIA